MSDFRISALVTAVCLAAAAWWGQHSGMGIGTAVWICLVLGVLEVSLSFDNAVVNASVLKTMDEFWRQMFLTVGIVIAVFGMRLVFPIVIVAVATGQGPEPVLRLALEQPEQYSRILSDNYPAIAAFGGSFLLLVFLNFLFDPRRRLHWLGRLERLAGALGRAGGMAVIGALLALLATRLLLPDEQFDDVLLAGVCGILLFLLVDSLDALFESEAPVAPAASATGPVARSGVAAFLYLEVLDASFSFDGVIGAFAITRDVVIIMLGLAIGAMFVRSLTVHLVHRGTLDRFVFLEHGAHYAIGALALTMLAGTAWHVPEVLSGLIGVGFIAASVASSLRYNRRRHAGEPLPRAD